MNFVLVILFSFITGTTLLALTIIIKYLKSKAINKTHIQDQIQEWVNPIKIKIFSFFKLLNNYAFEHFLFREITY